MGFAAWVCGFCFDLLLHVVSALIYYLCLYCVFVVLEGEEGDQKKKTYTFFDFLVFFRGTQVLETRFS